MNSTERRSSSGIVPQPEREGEMALYRFFDREHQLLYVGISDQPMRRWGYHAERRWWHDAASYEVMWYENRADAAAAERRAIRHESPLWNAAGTESGNAAIRAGVRAAAAGRAARAAARQAVQ